MIYERCPNAALVELLRDVARGSTPSAGRSSSRFPTAGAESVAEHRGLIEADRRRRAAPSEIEAAARGHKLAHRSRASAPGGAEHAKVAGTRHRQPTQVMRPSGRDVRAALEQLRDALLARPR